MAIIEMPQDPRQLALQQMAANWADDRYKQQQQQKYIAALNLMQQNLAPLNQQNQQSQADYNSLNDASNELSTAKQAYDLAQANGTLDDNTKAQLTQQANDARLKMAALKGLPAGLGGADQTLAQFQQAVTPILNADYNKAINPVSIGNDQILSAAALAAKNGVPFSEAFQAAQSLGNGYNQQSQDQIKKLQAKHDSIIVGHLQSQFGDALKNKDYGTAAKIAMQLEPYNIKTPEFITKVLEPPMSPYQQQTLALKQQEIGDREQGIGGYGRVGGRAGGVGGAGRVGGVVRNSSGFTPTQQRAQSNALSNAQAIYAAYDPNGKLDPTTGEYKPYTTAEQIKFNQAATMLNNAGISVGGNGNQQSDADQSAQQANDWNDRYQNVLADIANSQSDAERQQKVNYYEQNGQLQQFRDSGLDPDNDIAYIGGAGQRDNSSQPQQQSGNAGQQQDNDQSNDAAWYDQNWRQVKDQHPDWTDDQVTNYMTYLINNNGG